MFWELWRKQMTVIFFLSRLEFFSGSDKRAQQQQTGSEVSRKSSSASSVDASREGRDRRRRNKKKFRQFDKNCLDIASSSGIVLEKKLLKNIFSLIQLWAFLWGADIFWLWWIFQGGVRSKTMKIPKGRATGLCCLHLILGIPTVRFFWTKTVWKILHTHWSLFFLHGTESASFLAERLGYAPHPSSQIYRCYSVWYKVA